jgi:hypothetical protein
MTQVPLDAYVVDCLLPDLIGHDRRASAFLVYLWLYRQAAQEPNWAVRRSHQAIASATGLSRSAIQGALAHLQRRQLVATSRPNPTAVPLHRVLRPWLRLDRKKA